MKIRTRRPTPEDVPEIKDLAKNYDFPLVDKFDQAAVVTKINPESCTEDIVAFAVIRRICEGILYVTGEKRESVLALNELIELAKSDAKFLNHEEIYIFAQDEEFARILEKHFNFRRAKGVPMILDL